MLVGVENHDPHPSSTKFAITHHDWLPWLTLTMAAMVDIDQGYLAVAASLTGGNALSAFVSTIQVFFSQVPQLICYVY